MGAQSVAKQILDDQQKLVFQNEGTVKNDQGAVQYDQLQVEYCHITAPFTGMRRVCAWWIRET